MGIPKSSIVKDLNIIKTALNTRTQIHLERNGDGFIVLPYLTEEDTRRKVYIPSQTAVKFHQDQSSLLRVLKGPFGSGKSTMCAAEIIKLACAMPTWFQGRRKSRWAVVRNTSGELETTTLQTWLNWFGELGEVYIRRKPVLNVEHAFNIDDGTRVELQVLFLALDREDDLRKIRSLELSGVYVNEISEAPQGILGQFQGRLHRYPTESVSDYNSCIIADMNPPDTDHWLYKILEELRPDGYTIFSQPPGLKKDEVNQWVINPEAENLHIIGDKYYLNLAKGQTEEFIKVFCCGEYGTVIIGKKVYPEYNDDFHSVPHLELIADLPLYGGYDGGLTPALILFQISKTGQLRLLKEICGYDIWMEPFLERLVIPVLRQEFYDCKADDIFYDPSGIKHNDGYGDTYGDIFESLGFKGTPGRTNDIQKRIDAVKYFLNRNSAGEPSLILSRSGCPTLRKGFLGEYKYKRLKILNEERYHEKPDKNMYSHIHDALQYGALEFSVFGGGYKTEQDLSIFINPTISVL